MNKVLFVFILGGMLILSIFVVFVITSSGDSFQTVEEFDSEEVDQSPSVEENVVDSKQEPVNLVLPYAIESIDIKDGGVHPLGIYRFASESHPHPGIDLQLVKSSEIRAMADGEIVYIVADERFEGDWSIIRLQIGETQWAIEYEPIVLDSSIQQGTKVAKGQLLGTFEGGATLNPALLHIDVRLYGDESFQSQAGPGVCWINNLNEVDREDLNSVWNAAKNSPEFKKTWEESRLDGMYFLRGLLNEGAFPEGPMLCYDNVDAREPVE